MKTRAKTYSKYNKSAEEIRREEWLSGLRTIVKASNNFPKIDPKAMRRPMPRTLEGILLQAISDRIPIKNWLLLRENRKLVEELHEKIYGRPLEEKDGDVHGRTVGDLREIEHGIALESRTYESGSDSD